MNLITLALAETPREILIDGEIFVLTKRSALEALLPARAAGDRTTRSSAVRAARPATSRPAPKKLKAPPSRSTATRPAAAPEPEASEPVNGTLRNAVLEEITQNPGQTSLELFDQIRKTIPTTTIGSVYQSAKALYKKDLVKGQPSKEGTIWHPRSA